MPFLALLPFLFLFGFPLQDAKSLPSNLCARYEHGEISWDTLYEFLLQKYGKKEEGQSALQHHLQLLLVEQEAKRRGVHVAESSIASRISELEKSIQASAPSSSLQEELRSKQMSLEQFSDLLRISIAHEEMARQDLGLSAGEPITPAQLNLWLTERMSKSKPDESLISKQTLGKTIQTFLGRKTVKNIITEMVGMELVRKKAKEFKIELSAEDIDKEIGRRRARLASNEQLKGVSYEEVLKAQGTSVEELKQDSRFLATLLLAKIAEHLYSRETLETVYKKDAARYDGLFGESRKISWLLLRAAKFPNQFVKRSFEDAEKEMQSIRERIKAPEDFARIAKLHSEDDRNRAAGGEVGFIHRLEPDFDPTLLEAVFQAQPKAILGPFKTAQGLFLVLLEDIKPAPAHEQILNKVLDELRAEFYGQCLQEARIVTALDGE